MYRANKIIEYFILLANYNLHSVEILENYKTVDMQRNWQLN